LDDIKQNLLSYTGIKEAAILLKEDKQGNKFLIAYFTADSEKDIRDIKSSMAEKLPPYMQPSHFLQLPELPLTANGKLDRSGLPDPENIAATLVPINHIERALVQMWVEILHIDAEEIKEGQSFIELGGHSIKAFYLLSKIKKQFGIALKLKEIFVTNELRSMATLIASKERTKHIQIPKATKKDQYPLSAAQERMFFQHLLHEESAAYNISIPVRIHGDVDVVRIRETFNQLIERHESLRTGFKYGEEGIVQVIYDGLEVSLEILDEKEETPQAAFSNFIAPIDLFGQSLLRVGISYGHDANFMFIDLHHIVADGFSLNILVQDFISIYNNLPLDQLKASYVDYVEWLETPRSNLSVQREYWRNKLSGPIPQLNLPVSSNSLNFSKGRGSDKLTLHIDGQDMEKLNELAIKNDVSEYMLFLSFFYLLIARISGSSDIIIGTDVLGRTHSDLEKIVGTFVNLLPLRMTVKEETSFETLLQDVKKTVLEAFENQDFQFDQMLAQLSEDQAQNKMETVRVHFSFANLMEQYLAEKDFEIVQMKTKKDERVEFELMLEVRRQADYLIIDFIYDQLKYDEQTVGLLIDYYRNIMATFLKNNALSIGSIN
jgi:acyl carrier protein